MTTLAVSKNLAEPIHPPASEHNPLAGLALNRRVAQIEGWMSTYFLPPFDGSGGIGGPIATYWASSPYVAGPYVMNSYGLIRGLCVRAQDENAADARVRAERLATYYLRCQDPASGVYVCSWGETPFVPNGLIQQASVVAALWDLHRVWGDGEVAQSARRGWDACLQDRNLRSSWPVSNQALRACEALIIGMQARGDDRPSAGEKALLRRVGQLVASSQWTGSSPVASALPQALAHDDIIMPYQGKCLQPLVMLSQVLNDPLYLSTAKRLADFILKNMDLQQAGPVLGGRYLPVGAELPRARWLYRARRLWPFLEPYPRRYRQRRIERWEFNPWPQWLARGMDTARGLHHLGMALKDDAYIKAALAMVQKALEYMSPLGGIRNTQGFFGEDPDKVGLVWQDVAAIPRWNSYAVQFLHELAAGTPVLEPIKPGEGSRDSVDLPGNTLLIETPTELRHVKKSGKLIWKLPKAYRWGRPFRQVCAWNEGAAIAGRKASC
jgi:hypothetical protein